MFLKNVLASKIDKKVTIMNIFGTFSLKLFIWLTWMKNQYVLENIFINFLILDIENQGQNLIY